jgi:hypothetical protein
MSALNVVIPIYLTTPHAIPSQAKGLTILFVCFFTLTYPLRPSLIALRFVLGSVAMYYFWEYAYGPGKPPADIVGVTIGAWSAMMRTFDVCFASCWDEKPPMWVRVQEDGSVEKLPLPTSFSGRLAYSLDSLTTVRGLSWFRDVVWDWTPRRIILSRPRNQSRLRFLCSNAPAFAGVYICLDLIDIIKESSHFARSSSLYPIISSSPPLSLPMQAFYTLCVGIYTMMNIMRTYVTSSTICVALGSHPSSWPPMFDLPFSRNQSQGFGRPNGILPLTDHLTGLLAVSLDIH